MRDDLHAVNDAMVAESRRNVTRALDDQPWGKATEPAESSTPNRAERRRQWRDRARVAAPGKRGWSDPVPRRSGTAVAAVWPQGDGFMVVSYRATAVPPWAEKARRRAAGRRARQARKANRG